MGLPSSRGSDEICALGEFILTYWAAWRGWRSLVGVVIESVHEEVIKPATG